MKKIDLSCLLGRQVLCEFWNSGDEGYFSDIGVVNQIYGDCYEMMALNDNGRGLKCFDHCRIYSHPDYWIANDGTILLPPGLKVVHKDEHGELTEYTLTEESPFCDPDQETAFGLIRVVGTAAGWEW